MDTTYIYGAFYANQACLSDEIFAEIYSGHRNLQSETKICVDVWILIFGSRMFTASIPTIHVDFTRSIVDLETKCLEPPCRLTVSTS